MISILIVEDSALLGSVSTSRLQQELDVAIVWVTTYAEAREVVVEGGQSYDYAIVDLNLPDVDGMEIVDLMIENEIPPIVFTSDCSDNTRDQLWQRKVADYVLKEGAHNVDYLVYIIQRLEANRNVAVLVVDDSAVYRRQFGGLLRSQNLTVVECASGADALKELENRDNVRLVLADYHMDNMNGFELVKAIRKRHSKQEIAIIGMSYRGDDLLAARFLKTGANDFMDKASTTEQLFCRINLNIDTVEMVQELRHAAVRDHLTGLYNRRYFYESGEKLIQSARRRGQSYAIAVVDIDHFKSVNDQYGHATGDDVIRFVSSKLRARFRQSDIVARIGGEEFAVLVTDVDIASLPSVMESIRTSVNETPIRANGGEFRITISMGLAIDRAATLTDLLAIADKRLYIAKTMGRNCLVSES